MNCTYAADILKQASQWLAEGRPVAAATIIHITGSSSRPLATRMLCTDRDEFSGAISGGCVETDVCRIAQEVFSDGTARVVHYGAVKDPLLEVGLNCEGEIDLLVEPIDERWVKAARRPFTGVVSVQCLLEAQHSSRVSVRRTFCPSDKLFVEPSADDLVRDAWNVGTTRSARTATGFLMAEPVLPDPVLLVFGAGPVADALVRLARELEYRTVISDPRESRFPPGKSPADQIFVRWPNETLAELAAGGYLAFPRRTFIVSLEHEPRFEDALWRALRERVSDASQRPAYIGAIGKPQRAIERDQRARENGLDFSPLQPIRTPIGLDLGGKTPAEIALSILAQIVATVHERSGGHYDAPKPWEFKERVQARSE